MTQPLLQLSEAEFAQRYPLRRNPHHGGRLFETYGEDLAFVRRQNPYTVWTLVDGDNGGQYILSGFRYVNRIGFYISETPAPPDARILVLLPKEASHD
ncbi:MAG: hypothetical protein HZA51_18345 [Planctomycetes bacterium]|nr:hypothetical protein [Planctomycetota bacterium]